MCGIAGLFEPGGLRSPEAARRALADAAGRMAHRGPDAEGVQLLPEHGLGLAHRRLSILDLDPRANQPMASADGAAVVSFNGEIYNFRELRAELEKAGRRFRTESDTEVLLEGYQEWGLDALLERIAGMFAFALYDSRKKALFLARDRAGKKPLFYAAGPRGLAFASEIKALLALLPEAPRLDPAALDVYLSLKFAPAPRTMFEGILKVPPGSCLTASAAKDIAVRRYWTPLKTALEAPRSRGEALEKIEERFAAAVRRRLVSDVPVCVFLSGGIDSSLIAGRLAAEKAPLTAYTVGYGDLEGYNEFGFARQVADRFGLKHEEVRLGVEEARAALSDPALALDEPMSDWVWIPLHHLAARARRDGFKVALLGEGSDEVFFGYDVMLKGLGQLRRWEGSWARMGARGLAAALAPVYSVAGRGHSRYDLLRRAGEGGPVYLGSSIGWARSQRGQVAGPALLAGGAPEAGVDFVRGLESEFRAGAGEGRANRISYIEFYSKMGEVLLSRVDRVTMRHSLEARCPFLDHELVELAFSIPGDWKIEGGRLKSLLKDIGAKTLPPDVISRKKMGFSFPFKEWLRSSLGEEVERVFRGSRMIKDGWIDGGFCRRLLAEHRSGWQDHAPRLWALYDLCRWYDRWIA